MRRTPWFDRRFPALEDNGLLPGILERLAGTAPRLRSLLSGVEGASPVDPGWTLAHDVGHLIDLEQLWLTRAHDIIRGQTDLTVADFGNRATHAGDHDQWPLPQRFERARRALICALRDANESDLQRSVRHPRLGTPMRPHLTWPTSSPNTTITI